MLLAFDDTDGPDGGCTTHLLFDVLHALPGLAPRGLPRLVRLNPNVPWKTRGNGAVCVPLGGMEGPYASAGEWRGHEMRVYPDGPAGGVSQDVLDAVWQAVQKAASPSASPAVALLHGPPSALHYAAAVQGVVEPEDARRALEAEGGVWRADDDGRGLVGCLAAAAWPGPPSSYELLAYREPGRSGPRQVDPAPLLPLDATGETFHTVDPETGRLACVPSTPCPVLAGLRGRDPDRLRDAGVRALARAAQEPVDAWALWATNQASGDHVAPVRTVLEAPAYATVEVEVRVTGEPERRAGGHVFVPAEERGGMALHLVAFEPTRSFREVAAALRPGDEVVATGAWGEAILRLEKLEVRSVASVHRKTANPSCPACGRSMKSRGKDAGYGCACGTRAEASAATQMEEPRTLRPGAHEVPVMARRHLHRPLAWGPA